MRKRPEFHKEIGVQLKAWREKDKGWTMRQAAAIARQRGLRHLSRQKMLRLEGGQVKNPKAEVLRDLAKLYGREYEQLARLFIDRQFGNPTDGDKKPPSEAQQDTTSTKSVYPNGLPVRISSVGDQDDVEFSVDQARSEFSTAGIDPDTLADVNTLKELAQELAIESKRISSKSLQLANKILRRQAPNTRQAQPRRPRKHGGPR